jgi:transcriptional regulator with XRE-family HTH domain
MEEEKKSLELTIGEKIRDLREKKGLSLQDMASRTG